MTTSATPPKVSILVPIFRVEKYLRQCVDSILAQTLRDIEIILIDDGSDDACPQICDEYAAQDSRVRVIHKPNGGYGHTCNVGLETARGEYVAIVEPDDYIAPEMYSDLYAIACQHGSDIVKSAYCNYYDILGIMQAREVKWKVNVSPGESFTIFEQPQFLYYHPSIWSCIYKKEFLNRHHLRFVEAPGAGWTDNPFQVQTLLLAETINYTHRTYYYYRHLTLNEAEELKDWTLPFKRSDEIHHWLDAQNVTDAGVLSCIAMRELAYIDLVLRRVPFRQHAMVKPFIERMLERIDERILRSNPLATPRILREYFLLRRGKYLRRLLSLGNIRKFLFRINIKKESFCVQIFGIQIATPHYMITPALWRYIVK